MIMFPVRVLLNTSLKDVVCPAVFNVIAVAGYILILFIVAPAPADSRAMSPPAISVPLLPQRVPVVHQVSY